MRLAVFTPVPPQRTGIADYAHEMMPALAARADVDVYLPRSVPEPNALGSTVIRYDGLSPTLPDLGAYDAVIYQVGNNPAFHAEMVMIAARHPGIVVLHDVALHDLFLGLYAGLLERPDVYVTEAEFAHGDEGRAFAERTAAGDTSGMTTISAEHLPLNRRLIETAVGVIVNSGFAERLVRRTTRTPCRRIVHFGRPLDPPSNPATERRHLGLPQGGLLIGAFGDVIASKRIDVLLAAFADSGLDATLVIAGSGAPDLQDEVHRLDLDERVVLRPRTTEAELRSLIVSSDAIVNLRNPTRGETSGIAARTLTEGRPLVVSRGGWYDEIPDDAVLRVPTGEAEGTVLRHHLTSLGDTDVRHALERGSRAYGRQHSIEAAADGYIDFAREVADSGASDRAAHIARLAQVWGPTRDAPTGAQIEELVDLVVRRDPAT